MRCVVFLSALFLIACPTTEEEFSGCVDGDGDGYCSTSDCNDNDATVHPDAAELCNDIDDDCDGELGQLELTDADGDGSTACVDCNDDDENEFPGNEELCDGFDNDCDGAPGIDEVDADDDGHLACVDCQDETPDVAPGLPEVECDDRDTNCDGVLHFMEDDADDDGYTGCDGDCGPDDPEIHPGADEGCNFIDNDCDGSLGPDEIDGDGDGYLPCDDDCDDADPGNNPGNAEICDGLDNDCNGVADGVDAAGNPETTDADGDSISTCGGDCDDGDASVGAGLPEVCDGLDNDCNGMLDGQDPEGNPEADDADGDGSVDCVDCDDEDAAVSPLAAEACDGLDTDCNGLIDGVDALGAPEDTDADVDGFSPCAGDCDDGDDSVNPAGYDLPGGGDGNCDGVVGADAVGFGPWTEPEGDLLEFLELECLDHGLALGTRGFDVGTSAAPIAPAGVTIESELPSATGPLVHANSFQGVSPRNGGQFARTEGPALSVTLLFDVPQTMVALATQVFDPFIWDQYEAELWFEGAPLSSGVLYATDDPGLDTWAMRGWLSLGNVPFDEVRLVAPGFQQWVLDDLWLCE
jgi:hypothetical protein